MPKIGDAGVKTWQNHPTEITIKRNKTPPNLDLRFLEVQFFFWRFGMDEIESILSEITRFSFLLGIPDEATAVAQQHPDNARAC